MQTATVVSCAHRTNLPVTGQTEQKQTELGERRRTNSRFSRRDRWQTNQSPLKSTQLVACCVCASLVQPRKRRRVDQHHLRVATKQSREGDIRNVSAIVKANEQANDWFTGFPRAVSAECGTSLSPAVFSWAAALMCDSRHAVTFDLHGSQEPTASDAQSRITSAGVLAPDDRCFFVEVCFIRVYSPIRDCTVPLANVRQAKPKVTECLVIDNCPLLIVS